MQKISGILPASARTSVAEISVAQPARPGAPALGRPIGKNSLGDRITLSKEAEKFLESGAMALPERPLGTYKDTPENNKLKIIDDLNKKFFSKPTDLAKEGEDTLAEETIKRYDSARETAADSAPAQLENRTPQASLSDRGL
jgi:hypothetical protein